MSMESGLTEEARDILSEGSQEGKPQWVTWSSLSTMIMAMITAVGILLAGITLNEFFLERTVELIEVSEAGVDRVQIEVLESKHEILASMNQPVSSEEIARIRELRDEVEEKEAAIALEDAASRLALFEHELFAIGVTLLSMAITMSAVAVIMTRKRIWQVGILLGMVGFGFVAFAIYMMISN